MIDIMWSEILIIAVIALIFLGPSELLIVLKSLGKFFARAQETFQQFKMAIDHEVYKNDQKNTYEKEIKDPDLVDKIKNDE